MTDTERHEQWLIDLEVRLRYLEALNTPSDYALSHPEEPSDTEKLQDAVTECQKEFLKLIERSEKHPTKKKSYKY